MSFRGTGQTWVNRHRQLKQPVKQKPPKEKPSGVCIFGLAGEASYFFTFINSSRSRDFVGLAEVKG
jgi:hypothetical protein